LNKKLCLKKYLISYINEYFNIDMSNNLNTNINTFNSFVGIPGIDISLN